MMTLWDMLNVCQYYQEFDVYEGNDYDQNIIVASGTADELRTEIEIFDHLMDEVVSYSVEPDGVIVILLRNGRVKERVILLNDTRKKYQKERLEWLDKHNMCHKCGKQKCAHGKKFCFDCLEFYRENNRRRYNPELAKAYQARRRELYQQHKKDGICIRCREKATHGIYCYECSIKVKRYNMEKAAKRKRQRHERDLVPEYRIKNGLCYFCGEPIDEKRKRFSKCCAKCAENFSEISYRGDKTFFNQWRNAFWGEKLKNIEMGKQNAKKNQG